MAQVIVARRGPLVIFQRGSDGAAKVFVGNDTANAARYAGNSASSAAISEAWADRSEHLAYLASNPFADTTALNAYANDALAVGDPTTIVGDGVYQVTALGPVVWTRQGDDAAKVANDAALDATTNGAAQVTLASNEADRAEVAAEATRQPLGVEIYNNGSALIQGVYNGDYNANATYSVGRFTARIEDGTVGATADITVLVDGAAVYGPVTVTYGTELSTTPSYSVPIGADDSYLVERMTGTVRKLYIRGDGVPA